MLHFFGENGQKKLDLAAFNGFLEGLHAEIDRLEFQHYDPQGTVRRRRPAKLALVLPAHLAPCRLAKSFGQCHQLDIHVAA